MKFINMDGNLWDKTIRKQVKQVCEEFEIMYSMDMRNWMPWVSDKNKFVRVYSQGQM